MRRLYKIILLTALFFIIGFTAGYFIDAYKDRYDWARELNDLYPLRLNSNLYKFINPLLSYSIPSADQDVRFSNLKNKVSDLIESEKNNGLKRASVYLSDLNQGRWIGIDENDQYSPASMFKVVVMIAYLKGAEQEPGLLDRQLTYTKAIDDVVKSIPLDSGTSLKIGYDYTVSQLINKMIVDSDNGAKDLLMSNANPDFFEKLFDILGIKSYNPNADLLISPKQYSIFFRIIYNATFLSSDASEKALDLLSKTTFNDGLVAGVPKGTTVSHKFGLYAISNNNNIIDLELHDCGIVYYKTTPYFLCVMTDGSDVAELEKVIKNISSIVYKDYQNN
jgi:beta-lactamase class A